MRVKYLENKNTAKELSTVYYAYVYIKYILLKELLYHIISYHIISYHKQHYNLVSAITNLNLHFFTILIYSML